MLPRFLRSALDSTPLSLHLSISRSVSFSLPLYHALSPSSSLSPYFSSSIHLSRPLPLLPPLSLSLCLFVSLSLFLFLSVPLFLPLSSSTIYFSLFPSPLSPCFTPSLSRSLSLYSRLRRSRSSATELAIPQIVTASYRTIDSAVFLFFENLENFLEAPQMIATRSHLSIFSF